MKIFQEIYKFRSLLSALVVRHLSVRYRGSVLGFFWSLLNPLCLMLVYFLVFRYYIRFEHVHNYTVFLLSSLLPWIWVGSALNEGTAAIVASGHLITKSLFPAHILAAVSTLTSMVHFLLALPLLLIMMIATQEPLEPTLLALPVLVIVNLLFLYGLALGLATLNVYFRDVQHLVTNALTFIFFLCPIVYPPSVVPEAFKFTLKYNPFAQFIMAYQHIVVEGVLPPTGDILIMLGFTVASLIFGISIYQRCRESFAEAL